MVSFVHFILYRNNISQYLAPDPLLALGTYSKKVGNVSVGYTIVFDKFKHAQAYFAMGSSTADPNNTENVLTLSGPDAVNMNTIELTSDAIPVSMSGIGYILDRVRRCSLDILTICGYKIL